MMSRITLNLKKTAAKMFEEDSAQTLRFGGRKHKWRPAPGIGTVVIGVERQTEWVFLTLPNLVHRLITFQYDNNDR